MFNIQDKDHASRFPKFANNPVIPDAIAPQSIPLVAQRLAKAARVLLCGNTVIHVVKDFPLQCSVDCP